MQLSRLCLAILGGLLLNSAGAQAQTTPPDPQAATDKKNTIIVTATKQSPYSASAQNVSSAVVNAAQLRDANVTSTQQLSKVLPGLHIENSGILLYPNISLRGVSSAQDFYNSAVTMYVDGVPQLSTYTVQALTDVESVEMLRGPQGTLYGKSAQGGIVNIVTQQPDSTPRGYIESGINSRLGYHGKMNLSGPIQDGLLYGSATILRQVDRGNFRNASSGSDHLGGSKSNVGNIRLRLAPDDKPWETGLAITEECTHATQDTFLPYDKVKRRTLSLDPGSPDPRLRRCTHSQALTGKYTTDNWVINLVSAWQQQRYHELYPNSSLLINLHPERWNQDVQELRAATYGDGHTVDMVFGLYRQNTREKVNRTYDIFNAGMNYMNATSYTANKTMSAYGDLTWHLTDRFDLGGGLRVSHDKAKTNYSGTVMGSPYGAKNNNNDDQVLGQASAGYKLTDAWRVYSRIAQGYKPASFNYTPTIGSTSADPFSAEKSINYEVGSKYGGDTVQAQGAVFYTHTRNMQLYSGPSGMQTLDNAGSANAKGVELSASWQFTPGWSWDVNGTYTHSEFTGSTDRYKHNKVPFIPSYGASTSLNGYIDTRYGALMPRVGLNLVGAHYFDVDNNLRQGAYVTTDLRLGWQATERVNVGVYADNVFDRIYRTYGFTSGDSAYAQRNMGRTLGLDMRVDLF